MPPRPAGSLEALQRRRLLALQLGLAQSPRAPEASRLSAWLGVEPSLFAPRTPPGPGSPQREQEQAREQPQQHHPGQEALDQQPARQEQEQQPARQPAGQQAQQLQQQLAQQPGAGDGLGLQALDSLAATRRHIVMARQALRVRRSEPVRATAAPQRSSLAVPGSTFSSTRRPTATTSLNAETFTSWRTSLRASILHPACQSRQSPQRVEVGRALRCRLCREPWVWSCGGE